MKRLRRLLWTFTGVLAFLLASPSKASASLLACTDGASLQTYVDKGALGCFIGDKRFYDFFYTTVEGVPVAATAVTVETILGPDIGLTFVGEWNADNSLQNTYVYNLNYTVATLSGDPLIKDNTLEGDLYAGQSTQSAFATVNEVKCLGAAFAPINVCNGLVESLFITTPSTFSDHADFTPVSIVGVHNIIVVRGGTGLAEVDSFTNTFSQVQVPEPGILALMLLGAAASARAGRRTRG